jgi:hypothetical protein
MARESIVSAETIVPRRLTSQAKTAFIDRLYHLHSQIFSGVSRETFVQYVVEAPARLTKIRLYKNAAQEAVGYCAVHFFDQHMGRRPLTVMRAEGGLLQAYRGGNITLQFAFQEACKYRIAHPWAHLVYLGTFVHPGVFHMCLRFFHEIYPNDHSPTPASVRSLMLALVEAYGVPSVAGQQALVRNVGWITHETAQEKAMWASDPDPAVQLYIRCNPGYGKGYGLTTFIPLSFTNLCLSLARYLRRRATHHRPGSPLHAVPRGE